MDDHLPTDPNPDRTPDPEWALPSKEAVEYGRRHIAALRDRFRSMADSPQLTWEARAGWRKAAAALSHQMLANEGGCVIQPFDARWLDDEFRASMLTVYEQAADVRARDDQEDSR